MSLVIALTKGRILKETLPIIEAAGIKPLDDIHTSRKLKFVTNQPDIDLIVLRGSDVPTYVEYGAADLGIAGKDTLIEHGSDNYYEPLDLNIARCRMVTAGLIGSHLPEGRIRVATKYIKLAKEHYARVGRQADFIKLYGAMELAPAMSLADEIVDIVDTGNTLRANKLGERETIMQISTRVIVNKASMKMKLESIKPLLDAMASVVKS